MSLRSLSSAPFPGCSSVAHSVSPRCSVATDRCRILRSSHSPSLSLRSPRCSHPTSCGSRRMWISSAALASACAAVLAGMHHHPTTAHRPESTNLCSSSADRSSPGPWSKRNRNCFSSLRRDTDTRTRKYSRASQSSHRNLWHCSSATPAAPSGNCPDFHRRDYRHPCTNSSRWCPRNLYHCQSHRSGSPTGSC